MNKRIFSKFTLFKDKALLVFFVLFLSTLVFNPFINSLVSFKDASPAEKIGLLFANDFNTCVYVRSYHMLNGNLMNQLGWVNSACGHIFPLIVSPLVFFLQSKQFVAVYLSFLIPLILLYGVFFKIILEKISSSTRKITVLFIFSFFLSIPGTLGYYMGNVDIFLSLIIGFILLFQFNNEKLVKRHGKKFSVFLGILLGAIANAKVFLFPFTIVTILLSRNKLITFFSSLLTFLIITYIPRLFGSPTGIFTFLERIILWNERVTVNFSPSYNHSPVALASYFTNCLSTQNCEKFPNSFVAQIIIAIVLLGAFFSINLFKKKNLIELKRMLTRPRPVILKLFGTKADKYVLIFLFTLFTALINLVPRIAFNYRLYYSFPLILILLTETNELPKVRFYCYLSMTFLIIGGLWIVNLSPLMQGAIDARLMNIFVYLHFIFLIKSSYQLLTIKSKILFSNFHAKNPPASK